MYQIDYDEVRRRIHMTPVIPESTFVDELASVKGDVTLGERCGVFAGAVLRGDEESITVGEETNIQDGATLHCDEGNPLVIGKQVTIGHRAIVHGCVIGDGSLIGMGAIVMNGVKIGKNCLIGAGALVTQGTVIPDGSLAFGSPAKIIRPLRQEEMDDSIEKAKAYVMTVAENLKIRNGAKAGEK